MARMSLFSGGRRIVATEGPSALLTGFGPTAVGYLVQVGLIVVSLWSVPSVLTLRCLGRCEVRRVRVLEEAVLPDRGRPGDCRQVPHCDLSRGFECRRVSCFTVRLSDEWHRSPVAVRELVW